MKQRLFDGIAGVSLKRNEREVASRRHISGVCWVVAFVGVLLVGTAFFPIPLGPAVLSLLALHATYTGLVVSVIYIFDKPFGEQGMLEPLTFREFYDEWLAKIVAETPSGLQHGHDMLRKLE